MAADTRDAVAVVRFVDRFAAAMVEAGMPRMPARAFAVLLTLDDGACTSAELADALHVSPAAVSGAVRYLSQVGLVLKERLPGSRRDVYRLYSDLWYEMFGNRDAQFARWSDTVRDGAEAVGTGTPAGRRLDETRRFFEYLRAELPDLLERWRTQERERATPAR